MKVGFLGLGVMGYPMAGHLHKNGFEVCVYNRTLATADKWQQEYGGKVADNVKDAVIDADVVLMCLGRDEDVMSVVSAPEGVLAFIKKGAVLIDHTTTSAHLAQKLAKECADSGAEFLDAPVSGGEIGAINGVLSIMVGGKASTLNKVERLFKAYSKSITHIGPNGDGQRCKMVNQIAITGVLQGLSEALLFGQKAQLDMTKVIDAISGGAAGSWQLSNRAHTMLESKYDFGFAIKWMMKDLEYAIAEAKEKQAPMPVCESVLSRYKALSERGYIDADTSVLLESLRREYDE